MVTPPQLSTSAAARKGRSGQSARRALTRRGVLSRLPLIAATVAALWGVGCLTGCGSTTKIEPAKANAERTVNNGKAKTIYRIYPPGVKP